MKTTESLTIHGVAEAASPLAFFECFFFFQAEDGIRDYKVTGVQTCALPILVAQIGDELSHRGRAQHFRSALRASATSDERKPRVLRPLHDFVETRLPEEKIDEAGLAVGFEPAVQHATPDIAVHQQRAMSCVRERERQIGR